MNNQNTSLKVTSNGMKLVNKIILATVIGVTTLFMGANFALATGASGTSNGSVALTGIVSMVSDPVTKSMWVLTDSGNILRKIDAVTRTQTAQIALPSATKIIFDSVNNVVWALSPWTSVGNWTSNNTLTKVFINNPISKTSYNIGAGRMDFAFDSVTNSVWFTGPYGAGGPCACHYLQINRMPVVPPSTISVVGVTQDMSSVSMGQTVTFDSATKSIWIGNPYDEGSGWAGYAKIDVLTNVIVNHYRDGLLQVGMPTIFEPSTNSIWTLFAWDGGWLNGYSGFITKTDALTGTTVESYTFPDKLFPTNTADPTFLWEISPFYPTFDPVTNSIWVTTQGGPIGAMTPADYNSSCCSLTKIDVSNLTNVNSYPISATYPPNMYIGPIAFDPTTNSIWAYTGTEIKKIATGGNRSPIASIVIPTNGYSAKDGTSISFSGMGSDVDVEDTIAGYEWRDGACSTGPTISTASSFIKSDLSIGTHMIYFRVKDSQSAWSPDSWSVCDSRTITITTNPLPVVNAGVDQNITLPVSSVSVTGTATDDGSIASTNWTKVSGPVGGAITTPTALTTTITGLTAGTYTFRLTATDDSGATASDDIVVTVNPATCTLGGTTVSSGNTINAYQFSSVPAPATCVSVSQETRTCNNGTLSGSYQYDNCVVDTSCTTPWSTTVSSGDSVTAYQTTSAINCSSVSQTRNCNSGILSGTYTNQACTPSGPTETKFWNF